MKTIWKVLAAVLLVCLLLVGALAAYLTWFFDPNDYKKQMETAFAESTGRELTMSGDLELTLFPWLGLSVKDVSVSNPPEFGQEPFARIFSAQARVRLLPLLKRRVEVGKVLVNGMELHLILDALGRSNWEDFGAKGQAVEPAPAPSAAPAEGPGMAVEVSGVEVSNSRVIWEDRAKKERFEVSDVALSLGGIRPGAPMDLDLSFALQSETPRLDSTIRISGKALVQTDSNQYALTGMKADVTANGDFSGNRKVEGQLGGDIRMDGAQHTLAVEGLSFTLAGLTGSGAFTARDLDKDFSFSGSLRVSADSLRNTLENLGVKVDTREPGALGAARLELSFAGSKQAVEIKSIALALDDSKLKGSAGVQFSQPPRYSFQLAADVLNADRYLPPENQGASKIKPGAPAPSGQALPGTLKDLVLDGKLEVGVFTLAGISGSGVFQVKTLDKNLTFSGSLRAAADNLKNSLEKLGIAVDTREPGALGAARLELSFTGSTQAVEIKSIALALDDSKLKGSAGVQFSQPPRYSFQLAADVLNADRYLPPKNQGASEIKPGAPAPPGQALPGTLKDLVLDGKLEVGVFTLAGISGSGVFQVKTLDKNLTFSGSLRAAADNLKNSLEKLGIAVDTREPGTLGAARLELSFTGSTQAVEIKPIALALDDTHLKGSARVLLSHPPRYTFLLAADVLDADRYLPPKDTRAPEHKPAKQPPPSQADLSALKNLFLDGKLEVGAVTLAGMDMKDVLVQVMAKNGVLTIEPARSNLYGGSTLAQAGLDVTGKSPRLQVKDEIKLVQLGPLLSDLAGKGFLTGLGTVRTDLTAEGLDTPDILRTLNGTLALGVSDGTVKGVNLPGLIRESWAALKGVPLDQQAVRDTDFAKLTGTVHFAGGQAKSDDLLLITPLLRVSGRGAADLLQRSLDYTLSAAVLGDLRVTVAGVEKNLKNIQIPIRVTGTLDQPKFGIDPVELARQVAGQEIQEKKGEAVKRLEDAIQKNLPPILQQDAGKKARSLLDTLVP